MKATRRKVRAWLAPMREALRQLATGEVEAIRGYPVTLDRRDNAYARIDHCLAGYRQLIERLLPAQETTAAARLERRLATGTPLTVADIDAVFRELAQAEDGLIHFTPAELASAARTEEIAIELEAAGIIQQQEAA